MDTKNDTTEAEAIEAAVVSVEAEPTPVMLLTEDIAPSSVRPSTESVPRKKLLFSVVAATALVVAVAVATIVMLQPKHSATSYRVHDASGPAGSVAHTRIAV